MPLALLALLLVAPPAAADAKHDVAVEVRNVPPVVVHAWADDAGGVHVTVRDDNGAPDVDSVLVQGRGQPVESALIHSEGATAQYAAAAPDSADGWTVMVRDHMGATAFARVLPPASASPEDAARGLSTSSLPSEVLMVPGAPLVGLLAGVFVVAPLMTVSRTGPRSRKNDR